MMHQCECAISYAKWYVRSVCVARLGKKDILQCVTKWMAKNTVPVTIWGVPVWKGGGRRNISHLGTPRNHKVFVTIWGLTYTKRL